MIFTVILLSINFMVSSTYDSETCMKTTTKPSSRAPGYKSPAFALVFAQVLERFKKKKNGHIQDFFWSWQPHNEVAILLTVLQMN